MTLPTLTRRRRRRAEIDDLPVAVCEPAHDPSRRELAVRVATGIRVVLSWRPAHDDVFVSVDDSRTGERFELEVVRDRALHAFYHPFAYAAAGNGGRA